MTPALGELEQLVLLALLRLGEEAYGVTVRREIERRAGRELSFGTIYTTLMRLENKGYVVTHLGAPTPKRGGRRKKHYEITTAGSKALTHAINAIRQMTRGLDTAWGLP